MNTIIKNLCFSISLPFFLSGCLNLINEPSAKYLIKEQYSQQVTSDEDYPTGSELTVTIRKARTQSQELLVKLTTDINSLSELTIAENGQVLYEDDGRYLSIERVCLQPNNKLAVEYSGYYGGNQGDFKSVARQEAPNKEWSHLDLQENEESFSQPPANNCSHELEHEPNNTFKATTLCTCDYRELDNERELTEKLNAFIPTASRSLASDLDLEAEQRIFDLQLTPIQQSSEEFNQNIANFRENFSVTEFETPVYKFLQISRLDAPAFNNFSYSFVQLEEEWFFLYRASVSSKATHPLQDLYIINDHTLGIDEICVEDCDWWGVYGSAVVDFKSSTITFFTDE